MRSRFPPPRRAAVLGHVKRADRPTCLVGFRRTELPGRHWSCGEHSLHRGQTGSNGTKDGGSTGPLPARISSAPSPPPARAKPRPLGSAAAVRASPTHPHRGLAGTVSLTSDSLSRRACPTAFEAPPPLETALPDRLTIRYQDCQS